MEEPPYKTQIRGYIRQTLKHGERINKPFIKRQVVTSDKEIESILSEELFRFASIQRDLLRLLKAMLSAENIDEVRREAKTAVGRAEEKF